MFATPALNGREAEVRATILELSRELKYHLRLGNRWTGALRRTTFARNVQGSNTIEGIHATLDEIASITAGEKPPRLDEETRQALSGYQLAMTYVLQLAKGKVDIDASLLKSLHFMVSSYDMTKWPGRFREGPVYVQREQTGDIVYEGAAAKEVPSLIDQLTSAIRAEPYDDLLITAAMAHLNFVLVRPFKDGNGRMARILQSLVLAGDDELSPLFLTIEEYLGHHTQEYYDVLAVVGQSNWNTATFDAAHVKPWMRFMLKAHFNQVLEKKQLIASSEEAAQHMAEFVVEASLPERTLEALFTVMYGGTVSRARYITAVAESGEVISEQTATRDLGELVTAGLLEAHGDKRGRNYTASTRVREASRRAGLGYAWRTVDPFEEATP